MENMENTIDTSSEEVEIDLRELFFAVKRKIFLILAVGLVCGCIGGLVTNFLITPQYISTASVLVLSKETTLTSIADLQLGTQLTNDYKVLISSTSVLEQVIDNLGLDVKTEELRSTITVENPTDTRILEISVQNPDPVMAKEIVDEVAEVSSEYIGDKMEVVPPKVIEAGKIPTNRTSPSVAKNAMLGLMAGIIACMAIVAVYAVMDDSIKSEDDMVKYLGISVLASVPDRKDFISDKQKKKNRKRK